MTRNRVLFVTQTANALGGVEVWLERMVEGLGAAGWHPVVGLAKGPVFHRPDGYLAAHPYEEVVTIDCVTGTAEGRTRAVERAIETVEPEIVVPVNVASTLEAVLRAKASGRNVRLLAAIHGLGLSYFRDLAAFRGIVDRAVGTNRLTCKGLRGVSGLPSGRVGYAPYGADLSNAVADQREGSRFRIGYAGRLSETQKRCGDLLRVAAALQRREVPFVLEIAGEGPSEDALRSGVASMGLSGSVEFLGVVPHKELLSTFYPRLSALLVTSSWETGPIVAWEAMASGAVVVSTRYVGSAAEGTLIHGQNALMAGIGDVEVLATHLEALYRDRRLRARLAEAGRRTVLERYSWDTALRLWLREFEICRDSDLALDLPDFDQAPPRGRLDLWLGIGPAETVRQRIGLRMLHSDPGGEWPHALAAEAGEEEDLRVLSTLEGAVLASTSSVAS